MCYFTHGLMAARKPEVYAGKLWVSDFTSRLFSIDWQVLETSFGQFLWRNCGSIFNDHDAGSVWIRVSGLTPKQIAIGQWNGAKNVFLLSGVISTQAPPTRAIKLAQPLTDLQFQNFSIDVTAWNFDLCCSTNKMLCRLCFNQPPGLLTYWACLRSIFCPIRLFIGGIVCQNASQIVNKFTRWHYRFFRN